MSAAKPKVVNETGGQQDLQLFRNTWLAYFKLSKYLFASKKPIYNINEIPEKSEFYTPARKLTEELKISWENMTHEESNRIMLALLEDYYNAMAEVDTNKKNLVVEVTLKVKKP